MRCDWSVLNRTDTKSSVPVQVLGTEWLKSTFDLLEISKDYIKCGSLYKNKVALNFTSLQKIEDKSTLQCEDKTIKASDTVT